MPTLVCAGEQIKIIYEPGTMSLASFEHLFIFPFMSPLNSQADFLVFALISEAQTSGLRDKTLIVYFGFWCPITATEPWARFPPPQIAT
jgi:hypothetical protein